MDFIYPVDVARLKALARARGQAFIEHAGLRDSMRDDVVLTRLVWAAGQGWFPVMPDRSTHAAVDLGLPDGDGESWLGAPVVAIGEGEVVCVERGLVTPEGYAASRVIVRHPVAGGEVFALYQQLGEVRAHTGQLVQAGTPLGNVGWHGAFPHLHFAVASRTALGGSEDLGPEAAAASLPSGDGVWNVVRVRVERLPDGEWPSLPPEGPWYLYNAIELVRWCRGETYEHDIGSGTRHEVSFTAAQSSHDARPGQNNEAVCEMPLLHSAVLSASEPWLRLAHDPDFAPVGRGAKEPGPGAYKALQSALKACGYDLGATGPAHDGVDGIFGRTMESVLKDFQARRLGKLDLSLFARGPEDVRTDGKIDWLTLLGVDAVTAAHRDAPPEKLPTPAREAPKTVAPPADALPAAPGGTLVFDARAATRRLSLEIGLLAYQALLEWSDESQHQVGYSTPGHGAVNDHYVATFGEGFSEWPRMSPHLLKSPAGVKVDNAILKADDVPTYYAFGAEWKGTHFTNCCNSQLAALCVALGGGAFSVLTDGGEVAYDVTSDKPTIQVQRRKYRSGPWVKCAVPALRVFEALAVCRKETYLGLDDNDLFSMDFYGVPSGLRLLSLGEAVSKFTSRQADLVKLRVGDATHTLGHAFLIGEVRYGVWLTPTSPGRSKKKPAGSTAPDYVCDQSAFIRSERPQLYPAYPGAALYSPGAAPLTSGECSQIIREELEFERRLQAFLAVGPGASLEVDTFASTTAAPAPNTVQVAKVEVLGWRCLSANGTTSIVHSAAWTAPGPTKKDEEEKPWKIDEAATKAALHRGGFGGGFGISRPWRPVESIAFGRYYAVTRKGS